MDWSAIFTPSVPLVETIVRGSAVYLGLFVLLRVVLRRESRAVGTTDLLMMVLLADAAQNGMANNYTSVTDGLLLVATIIFWNIAMDALAFRVPLFERLIRPAALPIVRDGRMLRSNMRREFVTPDELLTELRKQGVADVGDVVRAAIESDGSFSVITRDRSSRQNEQETNASI